MQIGAELYGHGGIESDVEVISLMLELLAQCGLMDIHLDLGHVGIFQALSHQAKLNQAQESLLFNILQRKAKPELDEWLADTDINAELKLMFAKLPELNGGKETIIKARTIFAKADKQVWDALDNLEAIALKIACCLPALPISFDFAELRGFQYHTGVVFAAFVPAVGKEIARGGRYDNIGAVFGRARPATGFSADLKQLALLGKQAEQAQEQPRIFAPFHDDNSLKEKIRDLRAQGHCVIQQLPGQVGTATELRCTAVLEQDNQRWIIKTVA
jgi:ATP phosphoribosyltransferase regulatory subunit